MEYTEAQSRAIATLDDPLLIVACAGSGKTQVISRRVVEILKRDGVRPGNVVAFTFTEKAAAELKDRITTLVEVELGTVQGLAEMYVGTMHGYAMDLLQRHVPETFKYRVFDEVQSRLFADRNSNKAGLTTARVRVTGRPPRPLRRYVDSRVFLQAMNVLREDDVDEAVLPDDAVQARDLWRHALHQTHAVDFTELLRMAVDLLDSDPDDETAGSLVRFVRDTVRYVVVDEYQDTNRVQEQLIAGLCRFGANLCVVGDDDQTIYQWRGSAVTNIQQFDRRRDGVRVVTLDENFRSSPAVVDLAQSVAELNADERLAKKMVAAGHQRYEPGDILALSFQDSQAEASWMADRMERLRGQPFLDAPRAEPRGLSWSDMAVLYRSVAKDAEPVNLSETRSLANY